MSQQSPRSRVLDVRVFFPWPDGSKIAVYFGEAEEIHYYLAQTLTLRKSLENKHGNAQGSMERGMLRLTLIRDRRR